MQSFKDALFSVVLKLGNSKLRVPTPVEASRGDSHLEERFWDLIDETEGGRKDSLDQFEIGKHRVDSIFLVPQGAVVIELDGAEYHRDHEADYRRDMDLLKVVRGVIRIRYRDLMTYPRTTLFTIGRHYPRFRSKGVQTFDPHDDPQTATLLGITWRRSWNTNKEIIRRIKKGQRKQTAD